MRIERLIDYELLIKFMDLVFHEHEGSMDRLIGKWMDYIFKNQETSIDKVIKKGEPVKIGNRTIYPVIMFSTIELKDKFTYDAVTPFALAVIEGGERYFVSMDEENESIKKLLSEDLWEILGL